MFVSLLLDSKNRLDERDKGIRRDPHEFFYSPLGRLSRGHQGICSISHLCPQSFGRRPESSRDDIVVTKRLKATCDMIAINVLDPVIINDGKYVSMKERRIA